MPTTATGNVPTANTEVLQLADESGFREALQQLIGACRRHLRIYSQSLPRALYSDPVTIQALSDFARSSRYARIQILITDTAPLLRHPHRILPLIQRLSSRIELKKIQPTSEPTDWEFALADRDHVLQKTDLEKWAGSYHPQNPVRVRQLQEIFDQAWLHARPDTELKRLSL
ncbi:hypothetical protein [Microbulbifer mangrovi]|uniref:DUF7931 domain-containing protein n=1 Tax=Microbulbifer mangrovi TaxID=927787 RepID=UPI00117F6BCA|nr:hypothetical protein [Microbulbifer mangrovi]